jgi:hypothetical protein
MEDDNADYHDDEQEQMGAVDNSDDGAYHDEQDQDQGRLEGLSLSHGPAAAVHPIH